jgi:hypothetical protein
MKESTLLEYYNEEVTDLRPNHNTTFPKSSGEFLKKKRFIGLYVPILATSVIILLSLAISVM